MMFLPMAGGLDYMMFPTQTVLLGLEKLLYFKGNATRLVLCNSKVYLELENNDLYRSSSPDKPGT